ncbi:MAG: hypothetical protein IT236_13985 [Bacteroidia bacterium]|nr:hypothetical protein [Bacteroidia bacterium]
MKHIFLLAFISAISFVHSQNNPIMESGAYYPAQFTNAYFENQYPWMLIFAEGKTLKSLTLLNTVKNAEHSYYEFNALGKQTEIKLGKNSPNWQGLKRRITRWTLEYDGLGRLVKETKYDKKGNVVRAQNWEYYSKNLVKQLQVKGKGKLLYQNKFAYNADSLLTVSENFRIKGEQQFSKRRYEYDYAENKKLKQTRLFKNNKLKYTWNYECDEKGKFIKKDTATICTNVGFDNKGRSISVKHYSGNHKREYKEVYYKRTVNGNEYVSETERYVIVKGKEIMVLKYHVPDSIEPYFDYRFFNEKGVAIIHNRTDYSQYESAKKIISKGEAYYYNSRGQQYYRLVQEYSDKGLPVSSNVYGSKNKLKKKIEFVFTNKSEIQINHYKKGKLINSYKGSLSYY